jgi:hypothetical protein
MMKLLRPALLPMMLALAFVFPSSVHAAENTRPDILPSQIAEGSFFDMLPFYVWIIIAIIIAIIIMFIVFMRISPKKKKGEQAAKGNKQGKRPQPAMDARLKPQVNQAGAPRPKMTPEQGQPYMDESSAYQNETPPYHVTPAQSPAASMPPPNQARPPVGQPLQQPAQRMQPQPVPQQPLGPAPSPAGPRPVMQPQPMQAPRPVTPMQSNAPVSPQRVTPQPIPRQAAPGMQPRPRPAGPQPGFAQPQRMGPAIPPRMDFVIRNLSIVPPQVKQGDPVTISATVSNNGANLSSYSMVFRVNHVVENITEMSLGPGASQTAAITVNKETAGEYLVDVDGSRGVFTVIQRAPASFSISNLSITPEKVKQGQPIAVNFMVANNGERHGIYKAVINIKGISEAAEDIPLEPGETKSVTFNIIKDAAGFYPLSIEHLSARFVVEMDWKE